MLQKIFILLLATTVAIQASAQGLRENFYVKVLSEELNRNINKLHLPDLEKPFFLAYTLRNQFSYRINAERGQITSNYRQPVHTKMASVKLRVGNYHRNFDYMMYGGSFINLPDEDDADEIKRLLWLETDRAYKNNSGQYSSFMAGLKRLTINKEELALDDLSQIKPIVQDLGSAAPVSVHQTKWEDVMRKLSAIFDAYPDLTSSYCTISFNNYEDYLVSNEGTIIRKPGGYISFMAYAATADDDGDNYSDVYSITVKDIEELPSTEILSKEINEIITNIKNKQQAKAFDGAYMGPVLFEGNAVIDLVNQSFMTALSTKRKSILGYDNFGTDYEDKLGQKLISADLTLTARPALTTFSGKKTTGSFAIDDEGVKPPDSLVLIKNGILKNLLNGRTPTKKFPISQGFSQSMTGRSYGPGVLQLTSTNITPADSMKQRLIKAAKDEGLKEAYIIKNFAFNSMDIYRLDITTGKEEAVNECKITPVGMRGLRRFITASNRQQLHNMPEQSIIVPQSIIINEVEIEKQTSTSKPKPIIVSNPLLTQKQVPAKKTRKKKAATM